LDGTTTHNVTGEDPMLDDLALNSPGATETHALLWSSPAIDAIPPVSCTVAVDQRGVDRPFVDGCDIGAYERGLAVGGASMPASGVGLEGGCVGLAAALMVGMAGLAVAAGRKRMA
jgi:hypothetical protein